MASNYIKLPPSSGGGGGAVDSVNGLTGVVVLTKSSIGLGNVNNTSDANKPVSTATQTALNLKANIASPTFTGTVGGITKTMVGLGNADNTSDPNKPISTATQTALNLKQDLLSFTEASIPFAASDGSLDENNSELSWDNTELRVNLGHQVSLTGDIKGKIRIINERTDPGVYAVESAVVSYNSLVFTDDSSVSTIGVYGLSKVSVAAGKTNDGFLVGNYSSLGRIESGDDGSLAGAASYFASLSSGNSATKVTSQYAAFMTAFHSIDTNAGQITDMYDFLADSSSIGFGAVTNRYGIMIKPDSGYTKQNWLSGSVALGGSSYSVPTTTLKVNGDSQFTKSVTDSDALTILAESSVHTTADASNSAAGVQSSVTYTIDLGATNDKAISGTLNTVQRGDTSDEGTLEQMSGTLALLIHNSGTGGLTNRTSGFEVVNIPQQGTITDMYDFKSQRVPAGGTVTNHYGLYIAYDSATPLKNWIAGSSQMGGSSFSPTTDALLDLQSTTSALVIPRMLQTERDALVASAGMVIFNTDSTALEYYNGTAWV